jgi:hypothetical protein
MYTGTLIRDLMATVERTEQSAEQKRLTDEMELQRIYQLRVPFMQYERIYAGAA